MSSPCTCSVPTAARDDVDVVAEWLDVLGVAKVGDGVGGHLLLVFVKVHLAALHLDKALDDG